ncbi:hypothetical protein [Ferrovum myxofaciens]|uniref:hypothetical protein n=1 Tax=Ferrovum myxofaciens TaxID=416213 RepID=UPI001AF7690C|nr:hypothetical protein [Ferrovum myxofaciens]QSH81939.1 MAG: hypothetical protein HO273_13920 [Ferrovum myxofaciens]
MLFLLVVGCFMRFGAVSQSARRRKQGENGMARSQKMVRPARRVTEHCHGFLMEPERLA